MSLRPYGIPRKTVRKNTYLNVYHSDLEWLPVLTGTPPEVS